MKIRNNEVGCRAFFVGLIVWFALSLTGFAVCADESDDVLIPAAFSGGVPGIFSATTPAPISLFRGAVLERATDLSLPTPISNWQHERTYTSRLNQRTDVHGHQWLGGFQSRIIFSVDGGVRYRVNASASWLFQEKQGSFSPGSNFDATLVRQNTDAGTEFILTRNDSGDVEIFYGLDDAIPAPLRGKLKERTTRHYQSLKQTGETYTYDDQGRLTKIVTASPQQHRIRYTYETTNEGRVFLQKIEVTDSAKVKIAEIEYVYFDTATNPHADLGLPGDLVQVKVSERTAARGEWDARITQYRYHRKEATPPSPRTDGLDHQIKMVLEPDAIERILATNPEIKKPEDLLSRSDTEKLSGQHSVSEYASRSFTYFKDELDINEEIDTPWGKEQLVFKYAIGEVKHPILAGHVKTESIRSSCFSCGGNGVSGGVAKTYHYMQLEQESLEENPENSNTASHRQNLVSYIVIEDTLDSEGKAQYRTVYSLNSRGQELRKIDIENPTLPKLVTYATSTKRNQAGQIVETCSSEVHALIDTDNLVARFLHPYDTVSKSWANDTDTMEQSRGRIDLYEYDTETPPKQTGIRRKIGSRGEAYYVSATDYNASGHVTAEYIYPTRTTNRNATDRVATKYEYTYRDQESKIIKTRKEVRQAIPESQNGSGLPAITQDYYDTEGRLRWSMDALGVVTYYGYHPVQSLMTITVRDVDTANLPAVIIQKTHNAAPWFDPIPFQRAKDLPQAWNEISISEFDELGNRTQSRRAGGLPNIVLKEPRITIRLPQWDQAAGRPLSVITVDEMNATGQTLNFYTLPTSAVILDNGKPVGVDPSAKKLSWTRYEYNPLHGTLTHIDSYHRIPEEGTGTLGEHFYRTVTIYDRLGRSAATIQYVQDGKWQVDAQRYDWRDRIIETRRVVAMNPPVYTDLLDDSWIPLISRTIYDGDHVEKQLSYFDTGANDYTGINYKYDAWGRQRATESFAMSGTMEVSFGPCTVDDYNWRGNVIASAVYETAPNWNTVATSENYAATTTNGRRSLTKSYFDMRGAVYRSETFEIADDGTAGDSSVLNRYRDALGREIATERSGSHLRQETEYDALGRRIRTQKVLAEMGIVSMMEIEYDDGGHVVGQHTYDLNPGETTGITPTSTNYTRRTVYSWYDKAGRLTTQADYGSGGAIWGYFVKPARPETAPVNSSDSYLVTKTTFNADTGRVGITTDAAGRNSKVFRDALGRTIIQWQNYKTGTSTAADEDVENRFTYNGLGNTVTLTAVNPKTGNQVTRYLYEDLYNAVMQTNAIYPDSSDMDSSGTDQVKTAYYLDGNVKTITDQNGTVRQFTYDNQRRLIADTVLILGNGVDGLVRKIGCSYTWNGALASIASYDPSNAVLNEIKYEYDSNQRLSRLYQSHEGDVNTTTSHIIYQHAGIADGFRITGMTYPSGKTLSYGYDSRDNLTAISDGTAMLVSYFHSGSGSIIQTTYNEPGLSLTYANGGLDRFGQFVNHAWMKGNNPLVHIIHGYDYAGNRTSRHDAVYAANSELYAYDQVNQIKRLNRGTLNANKDAVAVANFMEAWDFDKTGNWVQYNRDGVIENRTHNTANEIQEIATHDKNGNMTVMHGLKGEYDAWNRLVEVRDSSDNLIARYDYNGANQRIKKTMEATVTQSFFNERWQELESTKSSSTEPQSLDCVYVWGTRYIDDMIYRQRGEEKLYSLADPNWNVVATTNASGVVQERMKYNAFGKVTWMNAAFTMKANSGFYWNRTFTGQVLDAKTGLMLYRNRYYHTELGRFATRDPIGYKGKDVNLYRYVSNLPLVFTDVSGLNADKIQCDSYRNSSAGKKQGLDDVFGFVLCTKNGGMIACTNTDRIKKWGFNNQTALDIIEKCIRAHERDHMIRHPSCPKDSRCPTAMEPPKDKKEQYKGECYAYDRELKCLAHADCSSSTDVTQCEFQVGRWWNDAKKGKDTFCELANITLP